MILRVSLSLLFLLAGTVLGQGKPKVDYLAAGKRHCRLMPVLLSALKQTRIAIIAAPAVGPTASVPARFLQSRSIHLNFVVPACSSQESV